MMIKPFVLCIRSALQMRRIRKTNMCLKKAFVFICMIATFIYLSSYTLKSFQATSLSSTIPITRSYTVTHKTEFCNFKDIDSAFVGRYDLRIIVITFNRPESLLRLINSLNNAYYEDDNVALEVWIDRSTEHVVHNKTVETLKSVKFSKGICNVFIHPVHVGIRGQWLSTLDLDPDSSEIAVILEDDLTVSPYFYTYLKRVHTKYSSREDIAGFSLHGKSVRHTDGRCCIDVSIDHLVFLYPTIGTSGFSPNPRQWVQFHKWLHYNLIGNLTVPLIRDHISTIWYTELSKEGKEDSMWEMEYLFYTHDRKEYILYPNLAGHQGLTFNWYESGLHFAKSSGHTLQDEYQNLLMTWNITRTDFPETPIYIDNGGHIISAVEKQNKKSHSSG